MGFGRFLRAFEMNIADSDRFGDAWVTGRDAERDNGERGAFPP